MKRYYLHLTLLTLVLVIASFMLLWCAPALFLVIMPITALYFAIVTGVEHNLVVRAAHKDARTFIKVFLGLTIGSLFLHLVVMAAYMFTHIQQAKLFALAFAVCYIVYLVFETAALVRFVRAYQKQVENHEEYKQ